MSVLSSMAAHRPAAPGCSGSCCAEARRHGRPGAIDYLTFLQIWALPPGLRHSLRDLVLGRRTRQPPDRPMRERRVDADRPVVIWRSALLAGSETFIRNHGDALTRWRPVYLGATRVESALARPDDVIAFPTPAGRRASCGCGSPAGRPRLTARAGRGCGRTSCTPTSAATAG